MQQDDQFWQTYRDILYRFALVRLHDASLADDIVQDVLLKAYQHLDTVRDDSKILPWLFQITRNALADQHRRRVVQVEMVEGITAVVTPAITLDNQAEKELAACLQPLIKKLPHIYQEALLLSEIQGLPQKEVARQQNISLSGAKSRIQRGRKLLKQSLQNCCKIELDRQQRVIQYEPTANCCAS